MEEAGLDRHAGGGEEAGDFPILNLDWRIDGDIGDDARNYLEVATDPFSVESIQQVALDGKKLVGNMMIRMA